MYLNKAYVTAVTMSVLGLAGCSGASGSPGEIASITSEQTGETPKDMSGNPSSPNTCVTGDPERICIGVKVVAYKDSNGSPTLTRERADEVTSKINDIWKSCNIGFQVDEYVDVDPSEKGLAFGAQAQNQASEIREAYAGENTFLLAVTGPWAGSYAAWTAMPGSSPYGVVVREEYGTDPVIVGHEFGHYLGLDHDDDSGNFMYYAPTVDGLRPEQCEAARKVAKESWQQMLRQ